ncbi:hypothetical protein Tco_0335044 [Tanacetum coccineum]
MVFGSIRIRLSNRDGEGFVFLSPLEREEQEVVDLSKNTRIPTSHVNTTQPSTQVEHGDTKDNVVFSDAHFFHFVHQEDNDEDVADHRFVPDWGFRDDLCICSFRACRELISHLATFTEDEVLSGFSNIEVVRHAYQSLGRCVLSQGELLKRHEQLNSDNVTLCNRRCPDKERELMDRRIRRRRGMIGGKLSQIRLHTSVEYRKSLVVPIGLCFTAGWLGGLNLGKNEDEVASMLSETSNLDIEGSKTWKDKHRELFTM